MVSKAVAKYQRVSWQRTRLVANEIRGVKAEDALAMLKFTPTKAAKVLYKVVRSAIANAENKDFYDIEKLVIGEIKVDKGPDQKRFTPRAYGRASLLRRPTSHISVTLVESNVKEEVSSGS